MKRVILFVWFIGTVFLLTGCFDYREIDDTAMVAGIAIDAGKEFKYKISVEIIEPADSESTSPKGKVLSDEGNSIEDCLKRLVNAATKQLHFSHCKLILFSEQIAKDGISLMVDYFLRDPEFRPDIYLAVVSGKDASEMLSVGEKDGRLCSFDYATVIENSYTETGSVPPTKLYQFPMDGPLSLLPQFADKEGIFVVMGSCGFRDGVQYAKLDLTVTQSVLLVSGEYRTGELLLVSRDGVEIPCQIRSVKTKKKIKSDNSLEIAVTVRCDILLTTLPKNFDISSREGIKKSEDEISRLLSEKIENDWKQTVSDGTVDIFGLSIFLHRHEPERFEEWKNNGGEETITLVPICEVTLANNSYSEERMAE